MQNNVVRFQKREYELSKLPDDLVTYKQCAELLHCCYHHIRNLVKKGKLKNYNLGYNKVSLSEALKVMGV